MERGAGAGVQQPGREAGIAIGVALLLMSVAALESTVAPWAPFYVGYIALATGLPLVLRRRDAQKVPRARVRYLIGAVLLAVALQGIVRLITRPVDLAAMFGRMFAVAGARWGRPPEAIGRIYILMILIWAGLGEELFYRMYLQTRLRLRWGVFASVVIASALFAVRHYVQMLLLWPHVPWGTATVWVTATFVVGLGIGWLYEASASLWPPIVCHYLFNLLA
jgi:membrane protease YdiL (CAAX protease family)